MVGRSAGQRRKLMKSDVDVDVGASSQQSHTLQELQQLLQLAVRHRVILQSTANKSRSTLVPRDTMQDAGRALPSGKRSTLYDVRPVSTGNSDRVRASIPLRWVATPPKPTQPSPLSGMGNESTAHRAVKLCRRKVKAGVAHWCL